jgi:hypothetical protein
VEVVIAKLNGQFSASQVVHDNRPITNQNRFCEHGSIVRMAIRAYRRSFVLSRASLVEISSSPIINPNPPNPKIKIQCKGCRIVSLERSKACCTVSTPASKYAANERDTLNFRTAARIRRLAMVLRQCVAEIEQQARIRLVGVLVRHPFIAEDSDLRET